MPGPVFAKGASLPDLDEAPWSDFRKTTPTKMIRVRGPFGCVTQEGPVDCADGWLALDAEGFPYPVAASVHAATYEEVDPSIARDADGHLLYDPSWMEE